MTLKLVCCILFASWVADGADPLATVVAAHYPRVLADFVAVHRLQERKEQAFVELRRNGVRYVVAAYTNGETGAFVLLEKTVDGYRVDQEISRESGQIVIGREPELTALDVDGDGTPEVIAHFTDWMRNAPHTWVLRVTDGHLQLISPMEEDGATLLGLPKFLDLNGSGALDMIDNVVVSRTQDDVKVEQEHYALRVGRYVALAPVDYYEVFFNDDKPLTRKFSVPAASLRKPARLILVNGDELGAPYRVASGKVTLNGRTISVRLGTSIARVKLNRINVLTVSLHGGKHASRVGVVVRHD